MVHEGVIRRSEDAFSDEISRGISVEAIAIAVSSVIRSSLWRIGMNREGVGAGGVCYAIESSSSSSHRLSHMRLPVWKVLAVSILMALPITWLKCHAVVAHVPEATQRMKMDNARFLLLFVRTKARRTSLRSRHDRLLPGHLFWDVLMED